MKTQAWLTLMCLAVSLPTQAQVFQPIELKDQELANLRGRYVMPGRIVSFGIVMTSTWQNANREVIGATSTKQIQQSTLKPQFYVTVIDEKGSGGTPTPGTGTVTGGGGLNTTSGVTQVVRAAGERRYQSHQGQPSHRCNATRPGAGTRLDLGRRQWRRFHERHQQRHRGADEHRRRQQPGQHGAEHRPRRADAEHHFAR